MPHQDPSSLSAADHLSPKAVIDDPPRQEASQSSLLRPFRSASPTQTLKLLRGLEDLQPRSEQHFIETVEKDRSSSEESSPMYQQFKA